MSQKKRRKKKSKFQYKQIGFDSNQQIQMYKWLQEAVQHNIVLQFEYQPESFMLFQSTRKDGKHLLRQHVYTTDYKVKFNPSVMEQNKELRKIFRHTLDQEYQYIDIKGGYNIWNNHSQFSINRKWVYQVYKIFVYMIQVEKLFKETWVPEQCRWTPKTKKLRKKYQENIVIQQYLNR